MKKFEVTLYAKGEEYVVVLNNQDDVEELQNFVWEVTNCEMAVKPFYEDEAEGFMEETEYHFGVPAKEVTVEEVKKMNEADRQITKALEETHQELLEEALEKIRAGKTIMDFEIVTRIATKVLEDDE